MYVEKRIKILCDSLNQSVYVSIQLIDVDSNFVVVPYSSTVVATTTFAFKYIDGESNTEKKHAG